MNIRAYLRIGGLRRSLPWAVALASLAVSGCQSDAPPVASASSAATHSGATATATAAAASLAGLIGTWNGTMSCSAGDVVLHLEIAPAKNATVTVRTAVFPLPSDDGTVDNTPVGILAQTGAASGPGVILQAGKWSTAPSGWSAFTLSGPAPSAAGTQFAGTSTSAGQGCSSFTVDRTKLTSATDASCSLTDLITRHEGGPQPRVYLDSANPPNPTVGIGYNLNQSGAAAQLAQAGAQYSAVRAGTADLTPSQIDSLFTVSMKAATDNAAQFYPGPALPDVPARRDALIDMAYTIKPAKLSDFVGVSDALEAGDFTTAAAEMLDSSWASVQAPARAVEDATMMLTGRFDPRGCTGVPTPTKPLAPRAPANAPCPPGAGTAAAPAGWSAVGQVAFTQGADKGVCVTTSALYWGGLVHPAGSAGTDYTVTAEGRLQPGTEGWGVAARATVSGESAVAHAIQYDAGVGGYRDNDYPGDEGPTQAAHLDQGWHLVAIVVQGNQYTETIDGTKVASGILPQAAESSGGAFIRVWQGSAVEIFDPTITPN